MISGTVGDMISGTVGGTVGGNAAFYLQHVNANISYKKKIQNKEAPLPYFQLQCLFVQQSLI